jgi:serine/threonine protein kinase
VKACVVCQSELKDDARFCPNCGAEQPKIDVAPGEDPLLGAIVARKFKIEKLLGVGGMGKVYKARQLALDKAVVVKVLHDQFRDDPQLVQRFQREARAASRLNHPNSIQIIDFGQDEGGVVFMAMEFLQGQDLFAHLKKEGPLEPGRLSRVMIQVCSALAEAHEMNVIHRDLKPENIMIEDRRGQRDYVKVLDFGIAKIQDPAENTNGQALTQAGMVCGTPEYMSPEQARGLNLDPRSDIYALGVIMYQLSTGELPFVSDTPIGIVTKHILEKPIPPRAKRPQIPEALEAIILKAMEKEPNGRFNTVVEMGEALEALSRALPPTGATGSFSVNSDKSGPMLAAPPTSSQPVPQPPVTTGPTGPTTSPTTSTPSATAPAQGALEVPPVRPGGSPAMKIAAAAVVVVLVAVIAAVVVKQMGKQPTVADAGVTVVATVVDAGVAAPPKVVDAGVVAVAVVDAGVAAPTVVDAGVAAPPKVVDAGVKQPPPPPPKVDAGVRPVDPPPSGNRAAAVAELKKHTAGVKPGQKCSDATEAGLRKAASLDKTFADPLWYVAICGKNAGESGIACSAVNTYAERGAPPAKVNVLRNMACR